MKVPCLMVSLLFFALSSSAQTLTNLSAGPGMTIMQKKWSIDVRNPALEKDPLAANKRREQEVRDQGDVARQNQKRIEQGLPTLPPPIRVPALERGPVGITVTYIYELKVKNTGKKEIRTLTWEYAFFEPGTEREVGRLRMVSKVRIGPGTTSNVVVRTTSSPTGTIDARQAGKKPRDQYSEQVVIKSVAYADGSVWQSTLK